MFGRSKNSLLVPAGYDPGNLQIIERDPIDLVVSRRANQAWYNSEKSGTPNTATQAIAEALGFTITVKMREGGERVYSQYGRHD